MIRCQSCGAQNALNTVFCEECGHNLLEQPSSEGAASAASPGAPQLVRITILDSGRMVDLPYGRDILVGRHGASQGAAPEVDLTNDGGMERGVSRRHALISFQGGHVYLQDLGSTNGTFLVRKTLQPFVEHPLQHGDEVTLGALALRIEFI